MAIPAILIADFSRTEAIEPTRPCGSTHSLKNMAGQYALARAAACSEALSYPFRLPKTRRTYRRRKMGGARGRADHDYSLGTAVLLGLRIQLSPFSIWRKWP